MSKRYSIEFRDPEFKKHRKVRALLVALKKHPVVKFQTDDSTEDSQLIGGLKWEHGFSSLFLFSVNSHVHFLIDEDFPGLEVK